MPPHIFPIRSLGPREWLQDFLSEGMQRRSLPSRPKEKKQQEIHLHNCSFETLTLGRAAATSFGGGIASSSPVRSPRTKRGRVQTRSKVRKRILSPQIISHGGSQKYSGKIFSSVPYLILVILQTTNAWHQLKSSAGDWAFSMADRMRITGHSFKNLPCILTRSRDARSGLLVGWNVGLSLKALSCECAVTPSKALDLFHRFPHKSPWNHAEKITKAEWLIKQLCKTARKKT